MLVIRSSQSGVVKNISRVVVLIAASWSFSTSIFQLQTNDPCIPMSIFHQPVFQNAVLNCLTPNNVGTSYCCTYNDSCRAIVGVPAKFTNFLCLFIFPAAFSFLFKILFRLQMNFYYPMYGKYFSYLGVLEDNLICCDVLLKILAIAFFCKQSCIKL